MNTIDHLSNSAINEYLNCGERFRLKRIERIPEPFPFSVIKGQAFHAMSEKNCRQHLETGAYMSHACLVSTLYDELEELFKAGEEKGFQIPKKLLFREDFRSYPFILAGQEPDPDATAADIRTLRREYFEELTALVPKYEEIFSQIRPIQVESFFDLNIQNGDHTITTRLGIDLICEFNYQGKKIPLLDIKVSGKKKSQNDLLKDWAQVIYALSYFFQFQQLPEHTGYLNFVVHRTPKKRELKTDFQVLNRTIDMRHITALEQRMMTVWTGINAGCFAPASPFYFGCNRDFCGYYPCQYCVDDTDVVADE